MCERGGAAGADDDAEAKDVVDVRGAFVLSEHLGRGGVISSSSAIWFVFCAFIVLGDSKQSPGGN